MQGIVNRDVSDVRGPKLQGTKEDIKILKAKQFCLPKFYIFQNRNDLFA
jgi:hypothetical protein